MKIPCWHQIRLSKKDCIFNSECFEENVKYEGDLEKHAGIHEDAEECQKACQQSPNCDAFTFRYTDKNCDFWRIPRSKVQALDNVSGKKYCKGW